MNLDKVRGAVIAIGVVPLLLIALGLFLKGRYAKPLLIVGAGWAIATLLFSMREVSGHITTAIGEITLTKTDEV